MTTFSQETKNALCIACTLAEVMKDCPKCAFVSGLPARLAWLESKGKAPKDDTVSTQEKESANEQ